MTVEAEEFRHGAQNRGPCAVVLRAHVPGGERTPWLARPQAALVLTRQGRVETEFGRESRLPRLRPVFEHLDQHFAEPLCVEQLAAVAGLSQGQFHRCFKTLTGTSPFEYAKRLRLQLAPGLLRSTDQTVAESGAQVGWADPFHFSKMFKGVYAQSPTAYRQRRDVLV